jgi:hypothetical protein
MPRSEARTLPEREEAANRAPALADVPLGAPYGRPLRLTAFEQAGAGRATAEVESPGQIIIQLFNRVSPQPVKPGVCQEATIHGLKAIALPIQNVGRGPAVIVRATLDGGESRRAPAPPASLPLVGGAFGPVGSVLVAPGQTRILAAASPGPFPVGDQIVCASMNPQGGALRAEITYRALKPPRAVDSQERTLVLGLKKGPGPDSQWQVGSTSVR